MEKKQGIKRKGREGRDTGWLGLTGAGWKGKGGEMRGVGGLGEE